MTEDLFSQRPRTLRGNKRIKRLSGPPAWRMMRQGKASPRETNQTIVWHSQTFSTVKPGEQEKRWKNSGWSYHLQNHVGMVSKDLIIGMKLNFLQLKKRNERKYVHETKRERKEWKSEGKQYGSLGPRNKLHARFPEREKREIHFRIAMMVSQVLSYTDDSGRRIQSTEVCHLEHLFQHGKGRR